MAAWPGAALVAVAVAILSAAPELCANSDRRDPPMLGRRPVTQLEQPSEYLSGVGEQLGRGGAARLLAVRARGFLSSTLFSSPLLALPRLHLSPSPHSLVHCAPLSSLSGSPSRSNTKTQRRCLSRVLWTTGGRFATARPSEPLSPMRRQRPFTWPTASVETEERRL